MPEGALFVRKGSPDAGVECYWKLANGDLCAWQAKFFREIPKEVQWREIDESVNKALERHQRLVRYTVCLPIDRSDPRDPKKHSFMDRWDERVRKWQRAAVEKRLTVEFPYWGQSEILGRLSEEGHRGRHYFWFNKELFSRDWFDRNLDVAVANAGRRYIPALNVNLPVRECFRGLGRTPEFFDEFDRLRGEIRRGCDDALGRDIELACPDLTAQLRDSVRAVVDTLSSLDRTSTAQLPIEPLREGIRGASRLAVSLASSVREAEQAEKGQAGAATSTRLMRFSGTQHYIYQLVDSLRRLGGLVRGDDCALANVPALLLEGDAGVGKTHLLCDTARSRLAADQSTVLLLGEQFSCDEPWSQVIRLLGISCSTEELLGALNAAGESRRCRTLILIDAVNEGEGIHLWRRHLAGILTQLTRYPWIGIAVSVRSTYEDVIVPEGLVPDRLIKVYHRGFAGLESVAVTRFFAHYGIASPGVPLMRTEFSNPLFLRLFCEAITNRGWTEVPSGVENLTGLFDFFLDSVNGKLARPDSLGFDNRDPLVRRAVQTIARSMADADRRWLPRDQARTQVNELHPSTAFEASLFRHMVSEGVLSEDRFWTPTGMAEGVRFTYERFGDHEIATYHLDRFLDVTDPAASFAPDQPLGRSVADERSCWNNAGLLSALAIQIPERIGRELPELAPHCASFQAVREAMIESLVWRSHGAFSQGTLDYLNSHLLGFRDTADHTHQALISVSTQPGHPYNANFLHKNLLRYTMAERDAWWSIFLHHQWSEDQGPIIRILDWAELPEAQAAITDEGRLLMGTTVAWFLTTSNRFLRDRATKALVTLYAGHLPVLCRLLQLFQGVNDLYVTERLLAVAYGCCMRSSNSEEVGEVAAWCYEAIFAHQPPPHILARDYARGVVERALHLGSAIAVDRARIEPPYGAKWPGSIPSEAKLKHLGEWKPDGGGVHVAQVSIYGSVMGFEDFARYVIGTNSGSFEWTALRLGKPRPPSAKQQCERFVGSLSVSQRELWDRLEHANSEYAASRWQLGLERDDGKQAEIQKSLERRSQDAGQRLVESLDRNQLRTYRRLVARQERTPPGEELAFDLKLVQRFVLNRIFQLGWTAGRFGDFDRYVNSRDYGRSAHKAERIGKKYQWLAYHEVLARVADNFTFSSGWSGSPRQYLGSWQVPGLRNIDPSNTLRSTECERVALEPSAWWAPKPPSSWRHIRSDLRWLRSMGDLPRIQATLQLSDPVDRRHWVTLQGFYRWEEPTPVDREWSEIPHRGIWYHLRSYIVRKKDFGEVFEWAQRQNYMNRWMPESHETYYVFLGEFFWSPAYRDACSSTHGVGAWTRGHEGERQIPHPVVVTAQEYLWEGGGYDCSIEKSVGMQVPCPWLADALGLRWCGKEGEFCDRRGRVVARDPSVNAAGPSALLIRESTLRSFLERAGYDIFWTLLGEKQIMMHAPFNARSEVSGAMAIRDRSVTGKATWRFLDFRRPHT